MAAEVVSTRALAALAPAQPAENGPSPLVELNSLVELVETTHQPGPQIRMTRGPKTKAYCHTDRASGPT